VVAIVICYTSESHPVLTAALVADYSSQKRLVVVDLAVLRAFETIVGELHTAIEAPSYTFHGRAILSSHIAGVAVWLNKIVVVLSNIIR